MEVVLFSQTRVHARDGWSLKMFGPIYNLNWYTNCELCGHHLCQDNNLLHHLIFTWYSFYDCVSFVRGSHVPYAACCMQTIFGNVIDVISVIWEPPEANSSMPLFLFQCGLCAFTHCIHFHSFPYRMRLQRVKRPMLPMCVGTTVRTFPVCENQGGMHARD